MGMLFASFRSVISSAAWLDFVANLLLIDKLCFPLTFCFPPSSPSLKHVFLWWHVIAVRKCRAQKFTFMRFHFFSSCIELMFFHALCKMIEVTPRVELPNLVNGSVCALYWQYVDLVFYFRVRFSPSAISVGKWSVGVFFLVNEESLPAECVAKFAPISGSINEWRCSMWFRLDFSLLNWRRQICSDRPLAAVNGYR